MPSAVLTLTGTQSGAWSSTPPTAANLHHTLVDDAYPPGDSTDYVNASGDGAGTESFFFSSGTTDINRVTNVNVALLMYGQPATETPAMRVEVWCQDVLYGGRVIGADSSGTWFDASINIPVDIPGNQWLSGTRVIKFIPLDGSSGYGPIPTE